MLKFERNHDRLMFCGDVIVLSRRTSDLKVECYFTLRTVNPIKEDNYYLVKLLPLP